MPGQNSPLFMIKIRMCVFSRESPPHAEAFSPSQSQPSGPPAGVPTPLTPWGDHATLYVSFKLLSSLGNYLALL